jgi:type II secretory pathway pseudopilin PulG
MKTAVVVIAVLAVLGALAGGVYLIGPPAEERARRLDARREADLQGLRLAVDLYWTRNGRLPASLDELHAAAGTDIYARDPQSERPYSYTVKSGEAYELCAEFARASELPGDFWSHGAGRQCFEITASRIRP